MIDKNFFGFVSLIFVVLSGAPYLYSVMLGQTRPHIFTWIVWGLATTIASAAQYAGHAGSGAWATGLSAVFCLATVLLSFSRGEKTITREDWIAFLLALSAIPFWYFTANPLIAVILVTVTDLLAYYPTFRKSYAKPHEEMVFHYMISNLKHVAAFFAMMTYSLTTLLYPLALFLANAALIGMLIWRRKRLSRGK